MFLSPLSTTISIALIFSLLSTDTIAKESSNALFNIKNLGTHEFSMRTRYHDIDDSNANNTSAKTIRLQLTSTFLLDDNEQWKLQVQPNYVHAFNDGDFNSITIKKDTASIPDGQGFNWSQANVNYDSEENWNITLGRQALAFDNERMIGAKEFWQTPQRFDAIKYEYNDNIQWKFQYAYTNKVHRIFGRKSKKAILKGDIRYNDFINGNLSLRPVNEWGVHDLNSHLFNLRYNTENNLTFVVYDYLIDNKDQPLFSSNTLGIKLSDEFKPAQLKYRYSFELAQQNNVYDNPNTYNTWYNLLEASVQYKSHLLQLSQEIFSEDNGNGFVTSLASTHKFQGWNDIFGQFGNQIDLRDQYITYKARHNKLRWRTVFHQFREHKSGEIIGRELDLELAYRFTQKWELKANYADYKSAKSTQNSVITQRDKKALFVVFSYNI